jgi:hypothetical protein
MIKPEECLSSMRGYSIFPSGDLFLKDGDGLTLIDFLELALDFSFLSEPIGFIFLLKNFY